jgi:hypothetical protein
MFNLLEREVNFKNYEISAKKLSVINIYQEHEKRKIKRKLQNSENRSNKVTLIFPESFTIKTYFVIHLNKFIAPLRIKNILFFVKSNLHFFGITT